MISSASPQCTAPTGRALALRLPIAKGITAVALLAPSVDAQGSGDVPFDENIVSAGSLPRSVAIADFDDDGLLDLAVANQFSSDVDVRLGLGGGAYLPATTYPVGSQPQTVIAADLDGDGLQDLVTCNAGSATVSVLLGLAGGAFANAVDYGCGANPQDVDAGDIDGDGPYDIVVAADSLATPVTLLRGLGGGVFAASTALGSGFCASTVRLADLDGDPAGDLELIVADVTTDEVHVTHSFAADAFDAAVSYAVAADPRGLAVDDVNGDGDRDVVVANSGGSDVSVLLATGSGLLSTAVQYGTGSLPLFVAVGDLDGDEYADILTTNFGSGDISLLLGFGDGTFGTAQTLSAGIVPMGVAIADVDGDYLLDFAVANSFSNNVSVFLSAVGPWVDLGGGVAGQVGAPSLVATGVPQDGALVTLTETGIPAGSTPGWLVIGRTRWSFPYKGGVFQPLPEAAVPMPPLVPITFRWPSGPQPGTSLYFQVWHDLNQFAGITAGSNGLRSVVQSP